jgi:hypothetical protein
LVAWLKLLAKFASMSGIQRVTVACSRFLPHNSFAADAHNHGVIQVILFEHALSTKSADLNPALIQALTKDGEAYLLAARLQCARLMIKEKLIYDQFISATFQ